MSAAELDDIRRLARPLAATADLDPLIDGARDARFVLLGEATHGTAEFYRWRAEITRRLIVEHGFSFVAVEGDWPDCFTVNQWVKGRGDQQATPREVLRRFDRWPTWMWANEEVAWFVDWLRDHNRTTGADVGFYGIDVYSLWDSLNGVFAYVREHQPEALDAAIEACRCFEPAREDPQRYAWRTRMVPSTCEDEVVELLTAVHGGPREVADDDPEAALDARQNAEVLVGAERYYRTMARADGESWNVRDEHMADTLDRLVEHHGPDARVVVWEHNTHIGDARATDMADAGMWNVGQLVRERHGDDVALLVGFAAHRGRVVASRSWGDPPEHMAMPAAHAGTHEALLHEALGAPALLVFGDDRSTPWLTARRGHRAVGVVYEPRADRWGNWVPTVMGGRYDALCWFEDTEALAALERGAGRRDAETATFPWSA